MIASIKTLVSRDTGSLNITDQRIIDSFISNPEFPWLISFPRTGSHWLRMMMELYFEKPSLVRTFYYKNVMDFTCYHRHDDDLDLEGINNVIYICRNPVDTVFSLLQYYKEDVGDLNKIKYRTYQYSDHLAKWLIKESFTKKKLVLTYEGLEKNLHAEFEKLTKFFDVDFDSRRLERVTVKISKVELKKKTRDNEKIVNIQSDYEQCRVNFRGKYSDIIKKELLNKNPELTNLSKFENIFY